MKLSAVSAPFDVARVREDFPILREKMHGKPLVYFDNAATSQKPHAVIDRLVRYYTTENSNVHRAFYQLSEKATEAYEQSRHKVREYLNARSESEIIYVRGATEGINLVAASWGRKFLQEGDEVIVSAMEHHANMVPWQLVCAEKGAKLRYIPVNENGELCMADYKALFNERTRFVSVVYVSNSIGTINPVNDLISEAKKYHIPILVDGCQAAPHLPVDVRALDCDFFVFSGHKTFAPTGIGVLYGKEKWLEEMDPYQSGGDMIRTVTFEGTTFNDLPHKFEAGTPHIAGAVGLAEAIAYVQGLGRDGIREYEETLLNYGREALAGVEGIRIIGTAKDKIPVFSFVVEGTHPLDVGTMLDFEGVAVRTGNHCTQPLLSLFDVSATCRASLAFYNTRAEIDHFVASLKKVVGKLR
ncbi:MAG: cysteine desulfurase [Bacteroidota bacterium]|nr:cysteine desulfurase [Bacteroidota bacterium]